MTLAQLWPLRPPVAPARFDWLCRRSRKRVHRQLHRFHWPLYHITCDGKWYRLRSSYCSILGPNSWRVIGQYPSCEQRLIFNKKSNCRDKLYGNGRISETNHESSLPLESGDVVDVYGARNWVSDEGAWTVWTLVTIKTSATNSTLGGA